MGGGDPDEIIWTGEGIDDPFVQIRDYMINRTQARQYEIAMEDDLLAIATEHWWKLLCDLGYEGEPD